MLCLTLNISPDSARGVLRGRQGNLCPERDSRAPGIEVGRLAGGLSVEAPSLGGRHQRPHVPPPHGSGPLGARRPPVGWSHGMYNCVQIYLSEVAWNPPPLSLLVSRNLSDRNMQITSHLMISLAVFFSWKVPSSFTAIMTILGEKFLHHVSIAFRIKYTSVIWTQLCLTNMTRKA